jgi:hypothetical protein|tara:strand:+ start:1381 stop:3795 length:2415 start_codon:yes stop_codon:yes gene_type:complete
MINTNYNSSFPDQVVPDSVKNSYDYGIQVGRAIENEWFRQDMGGDRYLQNFQNYHRLRLYARGEQPVQKYKDELSINGDLSYLNLDWKIVPVIPKFVDILVNGMTDKGYEIKSFATDPFAVKERTDFAFNAIRDITNKEQIEQLNALTGGNFYASADPASLPATEAELDLYLQLNYKQSIEIAEEEIIKNVFSYNKYPEIQRRIAYDLAVLGIGVSKTSFNLSEGITVDYVDPANVVYSYTEDPNFDDIYYVGEVKNLSLSEVKRLYPYLTDEDLEEIQKYKGPSNYSNYTRNYKGRDDNNLISVLFFEYKTYTNQVFKLKNTDQGLEKILEKDDTFDPPENDNFSRVARSIEVLYTGAKVLGLNKLLNWSLAENMTRPSSDVTRVNMNYSICAPRMYKGKIDSIVSRITGFADMIQLTHLKLQQVLARVVPDGVYLDMDGLAEVDLGNGTNYNPAEALNMYFQTGSIVGRSLTQDGDLNRGKVPIQELQSSSGVSKVQALISTYQYYLQMIRDVTGLNEAVDGSMPDKNALVGLQKMAAANSNVATRHILKALMYITIKIAENISLRANDALQFPLTKDALLNSINTFNVNTLEEMEKVAMHDFGIFLELEPDEEEKAKLEQNIQVALQAGGIDLDDAIDIREVSNIKLANQLLKLKKKERRQQEQAAQQANIQAQAQANAQASEAAALAEVQKQQALAETKVQIEKAKSDFEIARMEQEALIKKQLMAEEFNYNMQLAEIQASAITRKEQEIEDRKDKRVRIQGTQQSELIDQRKNDLLPKDFESAGNDNLSGFGLEQFEPR